MTEAQRSLVLPAHKPKPVWVAKAIDLAHKHARTRAPEPGGSGYVRRLPEAGLPTKLRVVGRTRRKHRATTLAQRDIHELPKSDENVTFTALRVISASSIFLPAK
jgi:hypothetical protein